MWGEAMIPVVPQPEPPSFEDKVRSPGRSFLRKFANPSNELFKRASYWQACLPELRQAYSEICAYSGCWVHYEGGTVDHFLPRSVRPDLAYEWTNYRLAFAKLNFYKGSSTNVLDPFHIQEGWFALDFANFFVQPNPDLPSDVETAVRTTISILRLNTDDLLVQLRFSVVKDYAKGDLTFDLLRRRYPFIASELQRQALTETIRARFHT